MGVRTGKTAAKSTAEARASTAPTPGGKKWLGKNPGSTSQLPSPAVVQSEIPETLVVVEADRPQTCPATTLVPQFHWNLNASALKTLTRDQVEQLYGLFKFYDSSMIGDALPSINCARLVEILRDARLLNSAMPVGKGLSVESVERIFAQAVMGKMRVYLDADDQPALTFPLFCGALMNCAMLLAPSLHPEPALRQILPTLLEGPIVGHQYSPAKGLLRHVPVNGATSLWIAGESHGPLQLEEATQDYRDLAPFQQVIADCTRDKILEEIKQEKLARVYEVPPQLAATFHEDTLALISNKFRLFDTFDRGWLPRHEVFSLLSSVGRRADLPDPHAVLAALTAAHANTTSEAARNLGRRSSADSGTLTLVQVLQAIEVTREAARLSTAAHLASKKVIPNRVKSAAPSGLGSTSSSQNTGAATSTLVENMDSGCNNDSSTDASKDDPQSNGITHSGGGTSSAKERGKRLPRGKSSRKSILSTGINNGNSTHALLGKLHNGSKTHLNRRTSTQGKKKSERLRKPSSKTASKVDPGTEPHDEDHFDSRSRRSGTSSNFSDDDRTVTVVDPLSSRSGATVHRGEADYRSFSGDWGTKIVSNNRHAMEYEQDTELVSLANTITVQMHEPRSVTNSKTIRIFLLLGGDHDGAICCTISLVFATRKIVDVEGIYYTTAPSETTRTTPVLPTQKSLANALLMLKKRVLARQEYGFELRPANQLNAVDEMLEQQQKRQPHFSIALKHTTKTPLRTSVGTDSMSPDKTSEPSRTISSIALNRVHSVRHSLSPMQKVQSNFTSPSPGQTSLPSNYKDLLAMWEVSQGENYAWIHDVNAASPLKLASSVHKQSQSSNFSPQKVSRAGHLSPLRFATRQ